AAPHQQVPPGGRSPPERCGPRAARPIPPPSPGGTRLPPARRPPSAGSPRSRVAAQSPPAAPRNSARLAPPWLVPPRHLHHRASGRAGAWVGGTNCATKEVPTFVGPAVGGGLGTGGAVQRRALRVMDRPTISRRRRM